MIATPAASAMRESAWSADQPRETKAVIRSRFWSTNSRKLLGGCGGGEQLSNVASSAIAASTLKSLDIIVIYVKVPWIIRRVANQ